MQCKASAYSVAVVVEPAGNNGRCLYAGVDISAPVDVIWGALTDYDGLGDFIPGLLEHKQTLYLQPLKTAKVNLL